MNPLEREYVTAAATPTELLYRLTIVCRIGLVGQQLLSLAAHHLITTGQAQPCGTFAALPPAAAEALRRSIQTLRPETRKESEDTCKRATQLQLWNV